MINRTTFDRQLIVFVENGVDFSSNRKILSEVFPSAMVAPIELDKKVAVVPPKPIGEVSSFTYDNLWYMKVDDVTIGFTSVSIEVKCSNLCVGIEEKEVIEKLHTILRKVLTIINVSDISIVAYSPKIGIDEDETHKVSDYLLSLVKTDINDYDLMGVSVAYKTKEKILREEVSLDCLCQFNKGTKKKKDEDVNTKCLIAEIVWNAKNGTPLSLDFIKDFFCNIYDWNDKLLKTILK